MGTAVKFAAVARWLRRGRGMAVVLGTTAILAPAPAAATPFSLIVNGGFESGLTNWFTASQPGSSGGWFSQTGTLSPLTGATVSAPPQGSWAAMAEQTGPGSHVIYQDFVVPMFVTQASLISAYFTASRSYCWSPTLDFTAPGCHQYVRVDIVNPTVDSNPFTMDPAALVAGGDASSNTVGYEWINPDITTALHGYGGQTLRLRIGVVNNQSPLLFGWDAASITGDAAAPVPEPGTIVLCGLGLAALAARRRAAQKRGGD